MPNEKKLSLQDLNMEEIKALIAEWKYPSFRASQIYLCAQQYRAYDEMNVIPKDLRERLADKYYDKALTVLERLIGKDGTEKYLYRLNDGNIVEGVFMPHNYGSTLCVSTQVGCRMGCAFCASTLNGLIRNLTSGEILSQVLCINALHGGTLKDRKITNVVLMGSGEPLDNFDNTVKFLRAVSDKDGINISLRNVSLSTCGLAEGIDRLALLSLPVTLTISLHCPNDECRSALMPVNKKYNIATVIKAAKHYFDVTGRRIIFEYSLIKNENSTVESAHSLARILRGLPCHVNLINLNPVKERNLKGVDKDTIKAFMDTLTECGISNTLRRSMGNDIEGACGQLRSKYLGEQGEKK